MVVSGIHIRLIVLLALTFNDNEKDGSMFMLSECIASIKRKRLKNRCQIKKATSSLILTLSDRMHSGSVFSLLLIVSYVGLSSIERLQN